MGAKLNPFTGRIDLVGDSGLLLDQTTPQSVINGTPIFVEGIAIAGATTYFAMNGNTLELYVNGVLRQSWTSTPATPDPGTPMGLLLALTYS